MADLDNGNGEPNNQPIVFDEQTTASFEALVDQYRRSEISFSDVSHELSLRIFVACNDLRRPGDAKNIFRSYYEELEAIRETNNVRTEPIQGQQQQQQPAPQREAPLAEQDQAEPRGAPRKRLRAQDFFEDDADDNDNDGSAAKRARRAPDESKFAFTKHKISYLLLDPLLVEISELKAEYSVDVNFAYNKLLLSPKLPQFPRQLWKSVLLGHSICFDRLYSALCAPNGDISESKQLGEYEVISDALKVTHKVTRAEEWLRVFHRYSKAVEFVYPCRGGELREYCDYITTVFQTTASIYHNRVIGYDRQVRERVGSTNDILLTEISRFSDLQLFWLSSLGAGFASLTSTTAGSSRKATRVSHPTVPASEVCKRFNRGEAHGDRCKYDHSCLECGRAGHGRHSCPDLKSGPVSKH